MISRLRAMLTPRVLFLLMTLVLGLWLIRGISPEENRISLERRASKTLSEMSGAGKVNVVISMRTQSNQPTGLQVHGEGQEMMPCGAIAVVEGADDPLVRIQITEALCALLGLPTSAVSVVSGGGN